MTRDSAAWPPLPPRLKPIVEAEYPRYSVAEMARRRAAVEAALAAADCGHLVFYGANRAGSAVQWLTQWPVTVEAIGVFTPRERDALFVQWINHAPLAKRLAGEADVLVISGLWHNGLLDRAKRLRLGDGLFEGVDVGPVINARQLERIHAYTEVGLGEGLGIAIDEPHLPGFRE